MNIPKTGQSQTSGVGLVITKTLVVMGDPTTTAPDALRSLAGVIVSEDAAIPEGLIEERIVGGPFACFMHHGSYDGLPGAWARIRNELLPASGG